MHRRLPYVVYEQIHSVVEGYAGAESASNVLMTDSVPSRRTLLVIEAQHSHVHG